MIEINNISKSYTKEVIKDASLVIPDGSIVGLVGINGAGKSTLLRLLAGVYEPDSGEILIDGVSISKDNLAKRNLFYIPDNPVFRRFDTPYSLIDYYKYWFNQIVPSVSFLSLLNRFHIDPNGHLMKFSKGMKRQTLLALGISLAPKYLLLDEAFDGVDPIARKELKTMLLKNQEKTNSTIILSSHSLRELEEICDLYLVVDNKKLYLYQNAEEFHYHKYIMAFDSDINKENLGIDFLSYDKDSKIITCIVKLDYKEMKEKLSKFEPKFLEEQVMTVEESFLTRIGIEGESHA